MAEAISATLVRAYAEDYSRAQLVTWRQAASAALAENLDRVELTSANFKEGGSGGQFVKGEPKFIVELMTAAIDYLDAEADAAQTKANPAMIHNDFSRRPVGW